MDQFILKNIVVCYKKLVRFYEEVRFTKEVRFMV